MLTLLLGKFTAFPGDHAAQTKSACFHKVQLQGDLYSLGDWLLFDRGGEKTHISEKYVEGINNTLYFHSNVWHMKIMYC